MSDRTEVAHTPRAVVMFSGGLGSWLTARRAAEIHGPENVTLLFADVGGSNRSRHVGEDEDTYRFIIEAAADALGVMLPKRLPAADWLDNRLLLDAGFVPGLVRVADGRDIWQVFRDDRFLGNSRLANCSKFLKQQPCREWLEANADPETTTVYVGIDWSEIHRLPAIERGWAPYPVAAPLTEPPYLDREQMQQACIDAGIELPRLYKAGFAHNNCGGFCVRAGQAQMELLAREHPERYAFHESEEQKLREYLEKDVSVLNDRTRAGILSHLGITERDLRYVTDSVCEDPICEAPDGCGHVTGHWEIAATGERLPNRVPLTLRRFRERVAGDPSLFDEFDIGGCGCFVQEEVGA